MGLILRSSSLANPGDSVTVKGSTLDWVEGDGNLVYLLNKINSGGGGSPYLKTGGASWSGTGLVYDVTALEYYFNGDKNTSATQVTLDASDATYDRFDAIVVDEDGVVSVIKGTAEANPITPTILENQLLVQYILVGDGNITVTGSAMVNAGNITVVDFTTSKYYGNISSAVSGNITYNLTNAVSGAKAIMFHQDSTEPILPIKTFKKNSTDYVLSSINVITLTFINNDCILCEMHNLMSASIEPELMVWLNKGGVASGFVLKAMNDFLMEIKPMRSRILRMNVMFGETFASMFIPLIINTDGSNVPLAGSLSYDTNVGYISSDWIMSGATAGLTVASTTKSISSNFSPLNVAEFGLDDASFGMFYNASGLGGVPHNSRAVIGGNIDLYIYSQNYPANTGIQLNGSKITTSQLSSGFPLIVNRSSNSSVDLYISGVKTTYSNASTAKTADVPSFGLPYIQGNVTVQLIGGYFIGKSLTDIQAALLRSAWVTLHTKLNHKVS